MSRTDPQFNLRIPEELRDKVTVASKANKRSATAEIIARIEATFAIDEALNEIAPGAPIYEAAPLILNLASERDEAHEALQDFNLAVYAKELRDHLGRSEQRLDKMESRIEYMIDQFKLLQK